MMDLPNEDSDEDTVIFTDDHDSQNCNDKPDRWPSPWKIPEQSADRAFNNERMGIGPHQEYQALSNSTIPAHHSLHDLQQQQSLLNIQTGALTQKPLSMGINSLYREKEPLQFFTDIRRDFHSTGTSSQGTKITLPNVEMQCPKDPHIAATSLYDERVRDPDRNIQGLRDSHISTTSYDNCERDPDMSRQNSRDLCFSVSINNSSGESNINIKCPRDPCTSTTCDSMIYPDVSRQREPLFNVSLFGSNIYKIMKEPDPCIPTTSHGIMGKYQGLKKRGSADQCVSATPQIDPPYNDRETRYQDLEKQSQSQMDLHLGVPHINRKWGESIQEQHMHESIQKKNVLTDHRYHKMEIQKEVINLSTGLSKFLKFNTGVILKDAWIDPSKKFINPEVATCQENSPGNNPVLDCEITYPPFFGDKPIDQSLEHKNKINEKNKSENVCKEVKIIDLETDGRFKINPTETPQLAALKATKTGLFANNVSSQEKDGELSEMALAMTKPSKEVFEGEANILSKPQLSVSLGQIESDPTRKISHEGKITDEENKIETNAQEEREISPQVQQNIDLEYIDSSSSEDFDTTKRVRNVQNSSFAVKHNSPSVSNLERMKYPGKLSYRKNYDQVSERKKDPRFHKSERENYVSPKKNFFPTRDARKKDRCVWFMKGRCLRTRCYYLHRYPKDDGIYCMHALRCRCSRPPEYCWYKHPPSKPKWEDTGYSEITPHGTTGVLYQHETIGDGKNIVNKRKGAVTNGNVTDVKKFISVECKAGTKNVDITHVSTCSDVAVTPDDNGSDDSSDSDNGPESSESTGAILKLLRSSVGSGSSTHINITPKVMVSSALDTEKNGPPAKTAQEIHTSVVRAVGGQTVSAPTANTSQEATGFSELQDNLISKPDNFHLHNKLEKNCFDGERVLSDKNIKNPSESIGMKKEITATLPPLANIEMCAVIRGSSIVKYNLSKTEENVDNHRSLNVQTPTKQMSSSNDETHRASLGKHRRTIDSNSDENTTLNTRHQTNIDNSDENSRASLSKRRCTIDSNSDESTTLNTRHQTNIDNSDENSRASLSKRRCTIDSNSDESTTLNTRHQTNIDNSDENSRASLSKRRCTIDSNSDESTTLNTRHQTSIDNSDENRASLSKRRCTIDSNSDESTTLNTRHQTNIDNSDENSRASLSKRRCTIDSNSDESTTLNTRHQTNIDNSDENRASLSKRRCTIDSNSDESTTLNTRHQTSIDNSDENRASLSKRQSIIDSNSDESATLNTRHQTSIDNSDENSRASLSKRLRTIDSNSDESTTLNTRHQTSIDNSDENSRASLSKRRRIINYDSDESMVNSKHKTSCKNKISLNKGRNISNSVNNNSGTHTIHQSSNDGKPTNRKRLGKEKSYYRQKELKSEHKKTKKNHVKSLCDDSHSETLYSHDLKKQKERENSNVRACQQKPKKHSNSQGINKRTEINSDSEKRHCIKETSKSKVEKWITDSVPMQEKNIDSGKDTNSELYNDVPQDLSLATSINYVENPKSSQVTIVNKQGNSSNSYLTENHYSAMETVDILESERPSQLGMQRLDSQADLRINKERELERYTLELFSEETTNPYEFMCESMRENNIEPWEDDRLSKLVNWEMNLRRFALISGGKRRSKEYNDKQYIWDTIINVPNLCDFWRLAYNG
nr:uncharacterized protein LOC128702576 isoform X2 [Cherax quadricarinatus]